MGKQSLQQFLGEWKVYPLHTFRKGFQRTWIVRAVSDPLEKVVARDYGLAVIQEAVPRPTNRPTERLQAPRDPFPPLQRRFSQGPTHAPKSWVGVVVGDGSAAKNSTARKHQNDGSMATSAANASELTSPVPAHVQAVSKVPSEASASAATPAAPPAQMPPNFTEIIAAAVAAAMEPWKKSFDQSFIPMQLTVESLQAEFVALRDLVPADDESMNDDAAVKRPADTNAAGRAKGPRGPNS